MRRNMQMTLRRMSRETWQSDKWDGEKRGKTGRDVNRRGGEAGYAADVSIENGHFGGSTLDKKMIKCRYFLLSTRFERTLFTKSRLNNFAKPPAKFPLVRNPDTFIPNRNVAPYKRCSWTQAAVDISPVKVKPYLRLIRIDKPIGTWLLYWPCTWSIGLATPAGCLPDVSLLALFAAGAFFMRGAGCIVNDLWDKEYDKKVARTKDRPLSNGDLTPFQATIFLGGLLSVSLGILLQLNWCSVIVGASSLILVVTYPLCKRITFWPQAVLGLTLNYGVLIAWTHINDRISGCAYALPLYLACVTHTIIYDTIYSHMDKSDDILIGVKSTALKFGQNTRYWLTGFAATMTGGLTLTGVLCDQTWPYYLGVLLTTGQVGWQISTLNTENSQDCWRKFASNKYLGLILFLSIVASNYLKSESGSKGMASERI